MALIIIPEDKMATYIKYAQKKNNSERPLVYCPHCDKIVKEGPIFPYYYDNENNDVYFASICHECNKLMIGKE